MAGKRVLAFDFGASSGRAILASYEDGKISMQEIHRFSNDPVTVCGVFHWDVLRLFFEIKQGITKAVHQGGFDAIGIDTRGVDFGLLDKKGRLLNNPVHYRDERTVGMIEKVFETIPAQELYGRTGSQNFGVAVLFWHGVLPPCPSSSTQFDTASVCPVFVDKKRRDRYDKEVYLLIFPRAAARADNREEQP